MKLKDEVAKDIVLTINKFLEKYKKENKIKRLTLAEKENLSKKYNSPLEERYNYVLNKILDEEKLFISEKDNNLLINGDSEAMKDLEIFKDMNFEEIDFYIFYVNYLSKKEYENKKVLVGYNGVDGKEVTMSKFKEALLNVQKVVDKGHIPSHNARRDVLNPLHYVVLFFNYYERILLEMKTGDKYEIFIYAFPYGTRAEELEKIYNDNDFLKSFDELKEMIEEEQKKILFNQKVENLSEKYNSSLDERYNYILNKILDEEKLFISEKNNNFIINGDSEAIKDLEIFKDMNFEEIDFYVFYVNYLSKKEYENKKVLVGYNGVDGKEVTMSKFKEDINQIRDSRSIYGREVEK